MQCLCGFYVAEVSGSRTEQDYASFFKTFTRRIPAAERFEQTAIDSFVREPANGDKAWIVQCELDTLHDQ
jgi:hypothetical protein